MKKISIWARNHKGLSRIIIVASFILLTALGIVTGILLTDVGVTISSAAMFVFISIYFTGLIVYPAKSLKGKRLSAAAFYMRQKSCDWLLAGSTFCMIVYFSNRPAEIFNYSTPLHAALPVSTNLPSDSTLKAYKTIEAFTASLKDETGKTLKWKEKKKLLKEQIRAIKKAGDMATGAKVGLIILSVLVALGLLYLVGALACGLSCNGSGGAAVAVMIGGVGLTVFLLIIAIRAILGRKKKPKTPKNKEKEPANEG